MASPARMGPKNSSLATSTKRGYDQASIFTGSNPTKRSKLSPPPLTPPESQPSTPEATTPSTPRSNDGRPRIYVCTKFPPCNQRFDRPCRLTEHERSHTGARPFVCTASPETCSKTFSRDYHLSRHVRHAHSDEATSRPFVCTFISSLASVNDSQHGQEDVEVCGKAFATKQRLILHERTHRDKPHCTEMVSDGNGGFRRCAAVFRKEITLKAHIDKVHRGVKPFVCGKEMKRIRNGEERLCEAGYDTLGKLNEHIRRCHSGPKYVCGICNESQDIADDMEVNEDMKSLAFASLAELAAHNRLIHPRPRGRPSGKSQDSQNERQKPKRRANQHTQRLDFVVSASAADLLTGPVDSNQLAPMIDTMEISPPVDTKGWIECLVGHCHEMFPSEILLGEHCAKVHTMAEVEIAEALREREALKGGVFWVGGWRDEEDLDEWNWAMQSTTMIDSNLEDVDMTL